jgi:hypothetical protein
MTNDELGRKRADFQEVDRNESVEAITHIHR